MFLRQRSHKKELLDYDFIPFEDIKQNMKELNVINTWLGGHKVSIKGLKTFLRKNKQSEWHICEIGCGGGDNLLAIEKWCDKNNITARFTGIDKKKECVEYAAACIPSSRYHWIVSDYQSVDFGSHQPDIIFSSLFCHHFTDEALQQMMGWMSSKSSIGFFINDLHRHRLAWASITILTQLFSRSYLVKNDAPLSVKRGFSRREWHDIMQRAGVTNYSITWKWAFRWLIIAK